MDSASHRCPAPQATRRLATLGVLASSALAILLAAPLVLEASAPRQAAADLYLPDVQAEIRSSSTGVALLAQEGLGATVIDAQNQSDVQNQVELELTPKSGTSPATIERSIDGRKIARFDLGAFASITGGFYAGRLSGTQSLGGTARVRWVSGAVSAYEAVPSARDFIVPLVARAVYSHTTILYAQNVDPGPEGNGITMLLFDPADGSPMVETVCASEVGETCTWDTNNARMVFGPDAVGTNAPTGGWLGTAWFRSAKPMAVMAYGDEIAAQGASAYLGRPAAKAASTQYAPLIRANAGGDSLIAIANAGDKTVQVAIQYRGAPFSPSGANVTFRQELSIPVHGAAFIDLSDRGRGSRPRPDLPRGTATDGGFVGSAEISASGPVLAVVQDEQLKDGRVDSVSAYNAFGPDDLGAEFGVTSVRKMTLYQSTVALLHNPGYSDIDVVAEVYDAGEAPVGQLSVKVPAGSVASLAFADLAALPAGVGRATLRGTGSFAALAYDVRDDRGVPPVAKTTVYMRSINDSHVSGVTRLTERGPDVLAELELGYTFPGARYTASIVTGACDGTMTPVFTLTEPTDGKSSTILRNLKIADLTGVRHSVLVRSAGFPGRPARDVACGAIEPAPGAEVVDTALSWPVRLASGAPIVSPTPPRTATPTGEATVPRPTATVTSTPPAPAFRVYLPIANRPQ